MSVFAQLHFTRLDLSKSDTEPLEFTRMVEDLKQEGYCFMKAPNHDTMVKWEGPEDAPFLVSKRFESGNPVHLSALPWSVRKIGNRDPETGIWQRVEFAPPTAAREVFTIG